MSLEIALAVIGAARRVGLSRKELHGVFLDNGMRVLGGVGAGEGVRRVEKAWTV
jgi:hypothetical protein